MLSSQRLTLLLLYAFLAGQITFWLFTKEIKPDMDIVPPVPGELEVKALSFGDEQFYFRRLAFQIQNAGDTFGRFTALKDYDYKKLTMWFDLLDSLDPVSNLVPAMASYYYSQTQNTPDVRYIVDYLERHVAFDPPQKWWWMAQAVYIANQKLHDKQLALRLAYKLAAIPGDLPIWARQMPAFIHADLGEREAALAIIMAISQSADKLTPGEINFMNYFIKDRLGYLEKSIDISPARTAKKHEKGDDVPPLILHEPSAETPKQVP